MIHRILPKLLFLSDSTIKNSTGKLVKIGFIKRKESKRNVCWTIQDEQYQFQMFYLDE